MIFTIAKLVVNLFAATLADRRCRRLRAECSYGCAVVAAGSGAM
jgi:hypothetical protein